MEKLFSKSFYVITLKGVGQIMLQESAITGTLFLLGILYSSWQIFIGVVLGTLVATFVGSLLKNNTKEYEQGLYGFNGALVGSAVIFVLGLHWWTLITVILGGVLSTYIMQFAIKKKLPVFTFPFIATSWLLIGLIQGYTHNEESTSANIDAAKQVNLNKEASTVTDLSHSETESNTSFFEQLEIEIDHFEELERDELLSALHSYGQVIFQGSLITGLLFLIGVYYNDPIAGVYGILGALFGILTAHLIHYSSVDIRHGLIGFNAVLCGITFAGIKRSNGLWVLFSTVLSTLIYILMTRYAIPAYTFPFVLSTWITLFIKYAEKQLRISKIN